MRFTGNLDRWNDDRGFGFIKAAHGGDPVFVHISAFARDGRRPKVGEPLSFEVEPAGDGKKRAVNVQRPGPPSSEPRTRTFRDRPGGRGPGRALGIAAGIAALAIGFAYSRYSSPVSATAAPASSPAAAAAYRCDGRTMCSQMTSCEEAMFFLKNCPGTKMDGNNDGIPCERQWCGRR